MKVSFAQLEEGRVKTGPLASGEGERKGVFVMTHTDGRVIHLLCDVGTTTQWEHVIIAAVQKTEEGQIVQAELDINTISFIKRLFWDDEETVMVILDDRCPSFDTHQPVHLLKSKRQTYLLPNPALFTPQAEPENVIAMPTPEPPAPEVESEPQS